MLTSRFGRITAAVSLVGYPLLIFVYWLLYPAYGKSGATAILSAVDGHATRTEVSDVFAFSAAFLAVPASLVFMALFVQHRSRIGWLGGLLSAAGWIAIVGALMLDVVAIEITRTSGTTPANIHLYHEVLTSRLTIVLEVIATAHVVGGTMIGVGLIRTRLVGLTAGVVATVTPVLHLVSNLAGVLWVDEATWIALAVVYAGVASTVLASDTAATPLRTATTAGVHGS